MGTEVEVKILDINKDKVEATLLKLGATKVFEGKLHAIFFDWQGRKESPKRVLRLRKEGNETYLTYKELREKSDVKDCEEIEVQVQDFEKTKQIFEKLGYLTHKETKKTRISYKINNTKIEFDTYEGHLSNIPTFIEIEADHKEDVFAMAHKLGFSKEDCKPWSTSDMVKHYETTKKDFRAS